MPRMLAFTICLLLPATVTAFGQQSSSPAPASATQSNTHNAEDLQALKSDTQQMRVLLNQMRNNLGFIENTTTPLHHQFELEIDMWQLVLEQMQRHITDLENAPPPKPGK